MATCEDFPCCGHEAGDCDGSLRDAVGHGSVTEEGTLMFMCCRENSIIIDTKCGRRARVCQECDNGINECTEGYCQHDKISDRGPDEPCQKGTVGCSIEHTKDGECETW